MQLKKWAALAAAGALAASLALFGCSSGDNGASDQPKDQNNDADAASYTLVKEGTLTVGTSPDYPPFENLDNGEYVGFDIDLAKAVADELGLECEFKTLQFDGIIPAVASGGQCDIGVSGFSVDPKRAKEVDFSDTYYIDDQAIAVMKDGGITKDNVDEVLNAEGMIIAAQTGTTGYDYATENYPNATIQGFGNSTDCFAAMQSGQANAVITNKAVVEKMLEAYTDAEIVKSVATGEEYAIVVSKDNPQLTADINKAIAKLEADGTIEELKAKNLG